MDIMQEHNMNDLAIVVENISKRYRIGVKEESHDNLAGAMLNIIKKPLANYRKFRSLYRFNDSVDQEDVSHREFQLRISYGHSKIFP